MHRVPFFASTAALIVLASCGGGSTPAGAPRTDSVLGRAIAALGGRERLTAIRTIDILASGMQAGDSYRLHVQMRMPDALRYDFETSEYRLVQSCVGEKMWSTFDGVARPITPEEVASVKQSWRLMQLNLLVTLDDPKSGAKIESRGVKDGVETIEVRFPDEPKGPFVLGFDAKTMLMRHVEWQTSLFGSRDRQAMRIELFDAKSFGGIMLATRNTLKLDGQLVRDEHVDELVFDRPILPERFAEPGAASESPIVERTARATSIALVDAEDGMTPASWKDAEERLAKWIDRRSLKRSGPNIHFHPTAETHTPGVGAAIEEPDPATRPTTRPTTAPSREPRVVRIPAQRMLATAVRGHEDAAREAAIDRLRRAALAQELDVAGPCRVVMWSEDITQVLLPVKPRN